MEHGMAWFALASTAGKNSPALVHDGQLYEVDELSRMGGIAAVLANWEQHSAALRKLGDSLPGKYKSVGRAEGHVAAPYRPQRIFCAAANYADHAKEMA